MKIYIFAYVCLLSIFATRGVKIERPCNYICTQVLRSAYGTKKTAKRKALNLNPHGEETYLEAVRSNIAKAATRGVKSPFGLAIITLALGSLVGLLYKRRKETTGVHGSGGSSGLFKYKCVKCNLVIFPSKGRDQKFVKEVGL
ncbi:hypothetical protein AK88_01272 [Plasmodium fragile]|uniref:Uncharacterized protein n=1 Tax=Plasmodium fragile TaxID=5857 RepID=A0A0D9QPE7_PLAFR|nr:uncharacterized protein AK88_01272 [Plasmodium fragile]KJP88980.1 hypothetical protein AK88_01272 [Plasmodium fragile]